MLLALLLLRLLRELLLDLLAAAAVAEVLRGVSHRASVHGFSTVKRVCWVMSRVRVLKYPRYTPHALRPPGTGAFFDFAAEVAKRHAVKLKSSSLIRHRLAKVAG